MDDFCRKFFYSTVCGDSIVSNFILLQSFIGQNILGSLSKAQTTKENENTRDYPVLKTVKVFILRL